MIGETLNHYRILGKLGEGGMAQVFRAEDTRLDRQVALKLLPPEVADDPVRIERFEREAKAVAALNHPNIVTIYSVEEDRGIRFLTMELVDGDSLEEHIPVGGMKLPRFFELAGPLLDAVGAAHRRGIVHRDIKPGNVMVNSEGIVKLLDLGLARLDPTLNPEAGDQTLTAEGRVIGTVPYMAPEQLAAQPLDHRIDIYALGVVFYEMLTGERPFRADSNAELISAILRDPPEQLTETRTSLPGELESCVANCLAKDPEDRFASIAELREALQAAESACAPDTATPPSRTTPIGKTVELATSGPAVSGAPGISGPRAWLLAAGVVAVVAMLAMLGFRALASRSDAPVSPPGLSLGLASVAQLGQPLDPDLAASLEASLQRDLGTVANLGVVDLGPAPEAAGTCDYVLVGTLDWRDPAPGGAPAISFEMVRTANSAVIWSEALDHPETSTAADLGAISATVRARIGELLGLPTPPAPRLAQVSPSERRSPPKTDSETNRASAGPPPGLIQAVERPSAAPSGRSATESEVELSLVLISNLPTGVVTIYADEERVYQREFSFSERKSGVLGRVGLRRKAAGQLDDGMLVPTGTTEIRAYVALPGEPARQFALEPSLRGDGTDRLLIDIRKKRDISVTLE